MLLGSKQMSNKNFSQLLTVSAENRPANVRADYVRVDHWGKNFDHSRFDNYLQNTETKKYCKAVAARVCLNPSELIIRPGRGKKGGIWVHPYIAIHYGEWLSPDFAVVVKDTFKRVVEGDSDLAAEMMIRDHNKERVERAKKRVLVCQTNKETMELAREWGSPYAQVHNDRYRGLYEMDAKQLRKDGGLSDKETPLDVLSEYDLTLNSLANQRAKILNNPNAMVKVANTLRRGHEEDIGQPLKPTWEKKRLRPNQARAIAYAPEYQTELPVSG